MSAFPRSAFSPELGRVVRELVAKGAVIGIGGQNIGRCAMATAIEIVAQGRRDLTLVGCNLSLHADVLVGAGCVRRLECGTGNLERFGVTHRIARAIEDRTIEIEDYDHLSMLARFVAAGTGVPFLPVRHMEGTDLIHATAPNGRAKTALLPNPWDPSENVRVVPALAPDVAIVHASSADADGNVQILGPQSHDPELIRASRAVLATVEHVHTNRSFDADTPGCVLPAVFFAAVVGAPRGAWPTAVHGVYAHDHDAIEAYQVVARVGGPGYAAQLQSWLASRRASS